MEYRIGPTRSMARGGRSCVVRALAHAPRCARSVPGASPAPPRAQASSECRHARLGSGRGVLPDLPGSIRRQRPRPQARFGGAVGHAADHARLQGWRPARDRRAPRLPRGSRRQRDLHDPDLPVRLEPSLPHVRLLQGRPAAGRRRGPSRAARPSPRARTSGSSSTASSITPVAGSGPSITSSRPAPPRRTATGSTSIPTCSPDTGC